MPRYVALLRGINVGGHRVKMDRLREMFEEMGFDQVATFIASGNVIFSTRTADADALETRIESHLASGLGYDVPTFIRSPAELEVIAAHPLAEAAGRENPDSSLYVIFLREPASAELSVAFQGLASEMDDFAASGREVYWHIQGKLSESPLFDRGLEKVIGNVLTTTRNMTTLRRLVAKL
jgi:uncharacterized protein (DUF1697 family)